MNRLKGLLPMLVQRAMGLILFIKGLGEPLSKRAGFYFLAYFGYLLICYPLVSWKHPKLFEERTSLKAQSPIWEKIILPIYWLLHFFILYYFAARDYGDPDWPEFFLGQVLFLLSSLLSCKSLLDNPFFDSKVHIQEKHVTITDGVYSWIRHPGYLAIIIGALGQGLLFTGLGARLILGLAVLLIIVRTGLEDKFLMKELPGYDAYSKKTKYRLFPYIW